jgi:hypothetical protein
MSFVNKRATFLDTKDGGAHRMNMNGLQDTIGDAALYKHQSGMGRRGIHIAS